MTVCHKMRKSVLSLHSTFIGSAIVKDLLAAGHQVVGIAHSDTSAKLLESLGVEVLHGSLEDLDILKQGAANSDGVIHWAFVHDFSDYAGSVKKERPDCCSNARHCP